MTTQPLVAIIIGSDSDLSVMKEAAEVLEKFNVSYEISVVSAHRTPDLMHTFAKKAAGRGVKVIIAGAGGAAHLPGMTAGLTPLPVIGVPIKGSKLEGLDALLSIAQMPSGVPVATVSINGAYNAGLLAIKILAINDTVLSQNLTIFMATQQKDVLKKSEKLHTLGFKKYLKDIAS